MIDELFPTRASGVVEVDPNPSTNCKCVCYCRVSDPDKNDTAQDEVRENK